MMIHTQSIVLVCQRERGVTTSSCNSTCTHFGILSYRIKTSICFKLTFWM